MKYKMPPNVGDMTPDEIYRWIEREKKLDDEDRRRTRQQRTILAVKLLVGVAGNALIYIASGFIYTSGPNDVASALSPRPVWALFQIMCNILILGLVYLEKHDS